MITLHLMFSILEIYIESNYMFPCDAKNHTVRHSKYPGRTTSKNPLDLGVVRKQMDAMDLGVVILTHLRKIW